jgi:hypothetical protein
MLKYRRTFLIMDKFERYYNEVHKGIWDPEFSSISEDYKSKIKSSMGYATWNFNEVIKDFYKAITEAFCKTFKKSNQPVLKGYIIQHQEWKWISKPFNGPYEIGVYSLDVPVIKDFLRYTPNGIVHLLDLKNNNSIAIFHSLLEVEDYKNKKA